MPKSNVINEQIYDRVSSVKFNLARHLLSNCFVKYISLEEFVMFLVELRKHFSFHFEGKKVG